MRASKKGESMMTARVLNVFSGGVAQSAEEAGWASVAQIAATMRLDRPTAHVSYTCEVGAVRITWTLSASGVCDFGRYGAREVA